MRDRFAVTMAALLVIPLHALVFIGCAGALAFVGVVAFVRRLAVGWR